MSAATALAASAGAAALLTLACSVTGGTAYLLVYIIGILNIAFPIAFATLSRTAAVQPHIVSRSAISMASSVAGTPVAFCCLAIVVAIIVVITAVIVVVCRSGGLIPYVVFDVVGPFCKAV